MPIRYLLKQCLLPPGVLFILILLGWLLRKRFPVLAWLMFLSGVGGLWAMSLPKTVEVAGRWLETETALGEAQWPGLAQRADVIVILGAGRERGDPSWDGADQSSLLALQRIRYAAHLARASALPLLTTGGLHYGEPPSEAELMAKVLADDYGLQVRWQERESRTTWENAAYSARILKDAGIRRVVLVTQAWHMPRARWCFEQFGLEVVAAPTGFLGTRPDLPLDGWLPEAKAFWQSGLLLNEALGRLVYPHLYQGTP